MEGRENGWFPVIKDTSIPSFMWGSAYLCSWVAGVLGAETSAFPCCGERIKPGSLVFSKFQMQWLHDLRALQVCCRLIPFLMLFFLCFFWVVHFCLKLSAWLDCYRCQSSSRSTLCGWFSSCCGSCNRCPNRGKFRDAELPFKRCISLMLEPSRFATNQTSWGGVLRACNLCQV